jgi:acyl-CoA thioesterase-1
MTGLLSIVRSLFLIVLPGLASMPLQAKSTILLLGDSLSASYGMVYEQGWVPLLQDKLDTADLPYRIINASISGETTGGGLVRLDRLLQEHQPDILWIELGGNDGLRGYPPVSIRQNLDTMATHAKQQGAEVWVTQIHIPPNYGPRYTNTFNEIFPAVAERHALRLIPFIIEDLFLTPGLMMADGIHPTSEAQPLIADKVLHLLTAIAMEKKNR